jgi:hypothetical protein
MWNRENEEIKEKDRKKENKNEIVNINCVF